MKSESMSKDKVGRILIVDDDKTQVGSFGFAMREKYLFTLAEKPDVMWQKLEEDARKPDTPEKPDDEKFDLLLLDLVLDPKQPEVFTGFELLPIIKKKYPHLPVIIVTNDKSWKTGKLAMDLGAEDFFPKDEFDAEGWMAKFKKIIANSKNEQEVEVLKVETQKLRAKTEYHQHPDYPFIGESSKIKTIRQTLKTLSQEPDIKVLLLGETGVGKGVAARFLQYNIEDRRNKPFEDIHISTISKDLLESTLFGAKKGTFTGSIADVVGRLEMANGGTVFLDEIGELTLDNQIKLLQFLQDKKIRPLGSQKDVLLDVHIISATNKDLDEEIEAGNFRQDLYYRINDYAIEIPPLRARREDIETLLMHFFNVKKEAKADFEQQFDKELLIWLNDKYDWPGNIRQLEKVSRALRVNKRRLGLDYYTMECLPDDVLKPTKSAAYQKEIVPNASDSTVLTTKEKIAWTELLDIEKALKQTNGRKDEAAELLALGDADNIYTRIKKYQKKYPQMVLQFPMIRSYYKTLVH